MCFLFLGHVAGLIVNGLSGTLVAPCERRSPLLSIISGWKVSSWVHQCVCEVAESKFGSLAGTERGRRSRTMFGL